MLICLFLTLWLKKWCSEYLILSLKGLVWWLKIFFMLLTDVKLINVLFFVKLQIKFSKLSHLTFKSHFKISINMVLNQKGLRMIILLGIRINQSHINTVPQVRTTSKITIGCSGHLASQPLQFYTLMHCREENMNFKLIFSCCQNQVN